MIGKAAFQAICLLAPAGFLLGAASTENAGSLVESLHDGHVSAVEWHSSEDLMKLEKQDIDPRAMATLLNEMCGPVACFFAGSMLLNEKPEFFEVVKECNMVDGERRCSMLDLKRCCQKMGFNPRAEYVATRVLTPEMLPAILHFEEPMPHFQLVLYMGHDKRIACVTQGEIFPLNPEEVQKRWSGHLLMLDPAPLKYQLIVPPLAAAVVPLLGCGMVLRQLRRRRSNSTSPSNLG